MEGSSCSLPLEVSSLGSTGLGCYPWFLKRSYGDIIVKDNDNKEMIDKFVFYS